METLKSARSRNVPWDEVAGAVRRLEARPDSSGLPPIRRAQQLSGYSANQLRRMMAGLVFLEDLGETDPAVAEWLGVPRFSHAEMLAKLWRRDRDATLRLLRSKPVLRYESLSRIFDNMSARTASPMSAGKQAQRAFEQKCLRVLLEKTTPFAPFGTGSCEILRPRVHHPYCRPALLMRSETRTGRIHWAGLDFVVRPAWDDATLRQLMVIGVEARFLDRHFVFFSERIVVDQAFRVAADLGFANVRIAHLAGSVVELAPAPAEADLFVLRAGWVPPRLSTTIASYAVDQ